MSSEDAAKSRISVRLNQQQLELIDRTLRGGLAESREELLHLALKEYAAKREGAARD